MRYEIEGGMIDIKEKSILLTKGNTTQGFMILTTNLTINSRLYVCSDIEDEKIYTIEMSEDGSINIEEGDRKRLEKVKEYEPQQEAKISVIIDHSKTINTIADKTGNVARKIKKLLAITAVSAVILFGIALVGSYISQQQAAKQAEEQARIAQQQKEEENRRLQQITDFIPQNYLGSYRIDYIFRNGKVLIWSFTESTSYSSNGESPIYTDTDKVSTLDKYITGRIDLASDKIDTMIDYNANGRYSVGEVETYRCTIARRNEYGAGDINFNSGGGESLYLLDGKTAKLQFNQGKDQVVYVLTRL